MSDEMVIFTRTFDLFDWLLPHIERFPKIYRTSISERLIHTLLDFQETLYDAQTQGGTTRQKFLRTADAHLNKVRFYLRLAYHKGWLLDGQYLHVSRMTDNIGGLLGGWIKAS
jgi:hypothetical protein